MVLSRLDGGLHRLLDPCIQRNRVGVLAHPHDLLPALVGEPKEVYALLGHGFETLSAVKGLWVTPEKAYMRARFLSLRGS